jgi:hypothetical protein
MMRSARFEAAPAALRNWPSAFSRAGRTGARAVAARMTVRSGRFELKRRLEAVWSLGFAEAGVAPLRVTADHSELSDDRWPAYRDQLIDVAREELARAKRGLPIRLTNFAIALKQIHAGASSPYPCGAGGGYFRSLPTATGTPAIVRSAMRAIVWDPHPHSMPIGGARFWPNGTSTPRWTAGCAGPATSAPAVATRRRRHERRRAAISSATGWISASRAIASCRARGLGTLSIHRCREQDNGTGTVPQPDRAKRSPGCVRFADASSLTQTTAGNPVSTRLESGIGNCFPGLECDLRNLERRFFPFLEVDIGDDQITLVGVDTDGVARAAASGELSQPKVATYSTLANELASGRSVFISRLSGTFGVLGSLDLTLASPSTAADFPQSSAGPGGRPRTHGPPFGC